MRWLMFFLVFSNAVFSQNTNGNVFTLKPALGLNGCQVHGDNFSGYKKFGVFAGTAVNARLSEKISFDLGFYFSQKGARKNQNQKNGDYTFYRLNLNYVDLPLSFIFLFNQRYFLTAGPSIAYLISHREENEYGAAPSTSTFNRFEIGLNIGIGGKINDKYSVELRSSNSITPVQSYGITATRVYYPNPVARFFNRGLYSNLLTLMFTRTIDLSSKNGQ